MKQSLEAHFLAASANYRHENVILKRQFRMKAD